MWPQQMAKPGEKPTKSVAQTVPKSEEKKLVQGMDDGDRYIVLPVQPQKIVVSDDRALGDNTGRTI